MTELPIIPHATIEPTAEGFAAKPLADTAEAHEAFQKAVMNFTYTQSEWQIFDIPRPGRFGSWDAVVFIPSC